MRRVNHQHEDEVTRVVAQLEKYAKDRSQVTASGAADLIVIYLRNNPTCPEVEKAVCDAIVASSRPNTQASAYGLQLAAALRLKKLVNGQ